MDANDGIEKDITFLVLSPEEIYQRKISRQELFAAVNSLPEKQAKRIYAHFFLGMSRAEIARIEGVSKPAVTNSIEKALKSIKKFIQGGLTFAQKICCLLEGYLLPPQMFFENQIIILSDTFSTWSEKESRIAGTPGLPV